MSADLTPADLAKFVHPIPKGTVVPVGTRYVVRASGFCYAVCQSEFVQGDEGATSPRWTAEPILTAEQQRLEDEYAAACEAVYVAERAAAKAREEADALGPRAESLYRELQKAGRR